MEVSVRNSYVPADSPTQSNVLAGRDALGATFTASGHTPSTPPPSQPNVPSMPFSPPPEPVLLKKELTDLVASLFRRPNLIRSLNASGLTKELSEMLRTVEARSSELPSETRDAVRAMVREIASDLRLTNRLNEFTPVVQIPLTLSDDTKSTASLYVWNDAESKGRRVDPKNATLFLSLFTAHIGRVEALCKVIGPSVECDFSARREDGAAALRGGGTALSKLLEAHGFKLQRFTASLKEHPSDLIDAGQERLAKRGHYMFDRSV
jgi:hypothetical protein